MDTTTLKNFAQTARRQLLEQVSARLEFVLGTDSAELREKESAVAELKTQINKFSKEAVIDKVAYTWFNRFCALRFMDVNGYTTMGTVSPADGHTLPQVLAEAKQGHIDETFDPYLNKKRVMDLLMGKVTSRDPQGEAYRHLLVAVCNYYHAAMPFLFEKIQDYTELLMPEDLLSDNSVLSAVKKALTPAACENVEVIGWLYQFYISERKDEVMARKSAVPTEDIPAVTQLFTPHWIVRYLVENSLGRLWLLNRPNSKLREHMPYYIEGEAEADFLKITKPEDIRLLDPACGSGHMLTYAFDLLYRIYEEEGYAPSEIPAFILQHNLHGLEICPRAAQLAQFALVCKAREKSRSAFRSPIQPQVMCLEDVVFVDGELAEYLKRCDLNEVFTDKVLEQGHQFRNMATFGSLLQPVLTVAEITDVQSRVKRVDPDNDLFLSETHKKVKCALDQAEMLSQRYHVVIANPPYMGTKAMNLVLKSYVNDVFSDGKADLYSVFMQRNSSLTLKGGYFAMITIPNWMFISSFEELRNRILRECYITTLIHNGRGVWGGDFGSCAFVIKNQQSSNRPGAYRRLFQKQGEIQSNSEIENNFFNLNVFPVFLASAEDFRKIPGSPIAYFTTDNVLSAFTNNKSLEDHGLVRQGASTSDNDRFLRLWFEITHSKIGFGIVDLDDASRSGLKWFPYNKGGSFRKWYGNQDFLINYENDGMELKEFQSTLNQGWTVRLKSREYYFKESVSWPKITAGTFSARYYPIGFIFDVAGCCYFPHENVSNKAVVALLNSRVVEKFLQILSPTLNFEIEQVKKVPFINLPDSSFPFLDETFKLARTDWDNFETSWNFCNFPLLRLGLKRASLETSWQNWEEKSADAIRRMQELETENNLLFINAYGLADEMKPDVPVDQITLARADVRKDMAAFLSYAIGCMMGRYSLDHPGLILADAGDTIENYLKKVGRPLDQLTFAPDTDGVIPILDGEWFEDDIVARVREFLRATFGKDTLEANLRFIEESIGKDLRTYFLKDFYKDHIQTYKKRPIYWMFSSPKNSFNVLIYLHRYRPDTASIVLNDYLREFRTKVSAQKEHQEAISASATASASTKTKALKDIEKLKKILDEINEYERDTLYPLATKKIAIDLDDGVKVNYCKFGKALRKIPGLDDEE